MAIRTKAKRATSRRRTVAVPVRPKPARLQLKSQGGVAAKKNGKPQAARKLKVKVKLKLKPHAKPSAKKLLLNGRSKSRPVIGHPTNGHPAAVPHHNGYAKALKFFATLTDHERLRIVRYNSDNFD